MPRWILIFAVCSLALSQTQNPQQGQEPDPGTIRVNVNEVLVPVTVTDYKGRFISNLDKTDFTIYEDGHEQKIQYFNRDHNQPVVVGFLMDTSSTSRIHWDRFKDTAQQLVWTLLSEENTNKCNGYLVTYSTEAELAVDTTSDATKITDRIAKLKPGGGAALYDAINLALTKHKWAEGEPLQRRRILIVIGSGNDSASKISLDQTIEIAQRNMVTIFGVSTSAYGFTNSGDVDLKRLADETGGRVLYPLEGVYKDIDGHLSKPQDAGNYSITVESGGYSTAIATAMFDAIAKVAGEVTTQYILRYSPPDNGNKKFRSIDVVVKVPDAKVRARRGYYPD